MNLCSGVGIAAIGSRPARWTVNGTVVQTGSSSSLSFFATSDFEIGVVVTDPAGAQVSATHAVMYEGCGKIIGCGGPQ